MSADFPHPSSMFPSPISETIQGLKRRLVLTIAVPTAWLSFTLLYVGFWAPGFTLFQSIIVVLVSLVLLIGTIAGIWVSFGFQQARRWIDW